MPARGMIFPLPIFLKSSRYTWDPLVLTILTIYSTSSLVCSCPMQSRKKDRSSKVRALSLFMSIREKAYRISSSENSQRLMSQPVVLVVKGFFMVTSLAQAGSSLGLGGGGLRPDGALIVMVIGGMVSLLSQLKKELPISLIPEMPDTDCMFSKLGLDMPLSNDCAFKQVIIGSMRYKGVLIEDISIFKTPLIYLQLLGYLLKDLFLKGVSFARHKGLTLAVICLSWFIVVLLPPLKGVKQFVIFALYWLLLGIASSIGLGTGLHTFVLYLGPHIAKVALAATDCGYLPEMLPSRWNFDHFAQCKPSSEQQIGLIGVVLAVQIQSFLWGAGTAIGELPPYFVAKKAAETARELRSMEREMENRDTNRRGVDQEETQLVEGETLGDLASNAEVDELTELENQPNPSCMDRAKLCIFRNLKKYGFWAILVCASVPNPLFDLAGITCGHFRIPFKTFFSATFIGKAIIKVHIQMIFVIAIFRKESLDFILSVLGWFSKSLSESAEHAFDSQKKVLYSPSDYKENKTVIGELWNFFILLMVMFFLKSIVDGQVQEKAIELKDPV